MTRRLTDKAPWVIGRAGMNYRDLIPDRLGGAIIAISILAPGGLSGLSGLTSKLRGLAIGRSS